MFNVRCCPFPLLAALLVFAVPAWPSAALSLSLDSGRVCLERGDVERARDFLAAAHAENPDDRAATLLYAKSLTDAQEAKELYTELIDAQGPPDSIKAEAHARLAGLAYATGDYNAAVEHYEASCTMRNGPECGAVLQRARRLQQAAVDMNQALVEKPAPRKPDKGGSRFVVQIGSYGSPENAERQKRSLQGADIAGVIIVQAEVNGARLYRVRVGSFDTRGDAQAFARRKLRPKNIPFSIVKE